VKDWPTHEQAGELWDAHVANWTGEDTPLSERWALWGELRSDTPRLWQLALSLGHRHGYETALLGEAEGFQNGRAAGHEEGAKAATEAVVRWLREREGYLRLGGGGPIVQARASLTDTYASAIERGAHLTPPGPTREQAEERCIERIARRAHEKNTDGGLWENDRLWWLKDARWTWDGLSQAARDAEVEAMLAELRGEGR
jgi:hypothetical protein